VNSLSDNAGSAEETGEYMEYGMGGLIYTTVHTEHIMKSI
jgi:hypothetical protein